MLLPMLINTAFNTGAIEVVEDGAYVKLVTKKLGATVVLSKVSKEAVYQMARSPDDPATYAEAVAKVAQMPADEPEVQQAALADDPVPLPVQQPVRERPKFQLIQGGRA